MRVKNGPHVNPLDETPSHAERRRIALEEKTVRAADYLARRTEAALLRAEAEAGRVAADTAEGSNK